MVSLDPANVEDDESLRVTNQLFDTTLLTLSGVGRDPAGLPGAYGEGLSI